MNPSLDVFGETERLIDDGKSRCRTAAREPGGGGINVARNLKRLGLDVLAIFPAGGLNGRALKDMLQHDGLPCQCIDIDAETRQNMAITETGTGTMYHFVFPGPTLRDEEWRRCLDAIDRLQPAPRYLVLSGSLPEGVPTDFFARSATAAAQRGIRVILDTSGAALKSVSGAGIHLAKLNRGEFRDLGYSGREVYGEMLGAMGEMVDSGVADALIVTLDANGALLATRDGHRMHVRPPATRVVSHVGAGDSFVSVLVYQLHQGLELTAAFRYGIAAAAAKVNTPGNLLPAMDRVERIYRQLSDNLA